MTVRQLANIDRDAGPRDWTGDEDDIPWPVIYPEPAPPDARVWRLTDQAEREARDERRAELVWWISGGGPTVAEVDANGGPFSPAELRERWQRSRQP